MLLISSVKEKKMRIQDEYSKAKMHVWFLFESVQ